MDLQSLAIEQRHTEVHKNVLAWYISTMLAIVKPTSSWSIEMHSFWGIISTKPTEIILRAIIESPEPPGGPRLIAEILELKVVNTTSVAFKFDQTFNSIPALKFSDIWTALQIMYYKTDYLDRLLINCFPFRALDSVCSWTRWSHLSIISFSAKSSSVKLDRVGKALWSLLGCMWCSLSVHGTFSTDVWLSKVMVWFLWCLCVRSFQWEKFSRLG